jgi:putative ABC transport system ATP-binding protein
MIRLEELAFRYPGGPFRLDVPELAVEAGERVALVGPSGSGKTTLLRLIAGIETPNAGRASANGVEVGALGDAERRRFRLRGIGLVFQEFELLEYLSVLDNVLLPYRLDGSLPGRVEARERSTELARRVGLGDKLGRRPAHLSQGERQRVAVCRALVTRPSLVLADEPTGNLDPRTGGRVLDELIEFATEDGATLVVVTHDHGLLERFDRVVDVGDFSTAAPEVVA